MTRKDWLCPTCGDVMVRFPYNRYMLCLRGHGKLHPVWGVKDLPCARKVSSRDFWIKLDAGKYQFRSGRYQYIPHGHKTALEKAPAEGQVVASVAFRGGRAVRLFKKKEARKDTHRRSTEEIWDKIVARSERYTRRIEAHQENSRLDSRLMFSYRGGE